MIFVTVGTHDQGFERLVQKMDEIAGQIDEKVVIQVGYTDYEPVNAEWFKFVDMEKIMDYYQNSRVIIAHAGAGTLLDCFEFNKPIIVVPRLKEFNEHIDNQQLELAEVLYKVKGVIFVLDIGILHEIILRSYSNVFNEYESIDTLKNYIKCLLND
ncbi:PssE/Cps14G family polysaccharide biosynthesis glycosyltransferase [Methanobacterium movens]